MDRKFKGRSAMEKEIIYKNLLLEILSRLDEGQLFGIIDEIGRGSVYGEELCRLLEEGYNRDEEQFLSMEAWKQRLKRELKADKGHCREFYNELIYFIDREHKTDAQVYNAIGMNRTLWYRLRDNRNARTNKRNVIKMAIYLHLDYWEMYYLINLAGYSLLPGDNETDRIVASCVRHKLYDQRQIDELLCEAGERPLFSE